MISLTTWGYFSSCRGRRFWAGISGSKQPRDPIFGECALVWFVSYLPLPALNLVAAAVLPPWWFCIEMWRQNLGKFCTVFVTCLHSWVFSATAEQRQEKRSFLYGAHFALKWKSLHEFKRLGLVKTCDLTLLNSTLFPSYSWLVHKRCWPNLKNFPMKVSRDFSEA